MGQETSVAPATPRGDLGLRYFSVAVIRRIRRFLVGALIATVVYSWLNSGTKGGCFGGVTAEGGFLDSTGSATDSAPMCVHLQLAPSPLLYAIIAGIVIVALSRIISRAVDTADAIRILDRAAIVIVVLIVAAIAISHIWFWSIPLEQWDGGDGVTLIAPFPFGGIHVELSTMSPGT